MATPRRIYWDACAWIALIQKEQIRDAKTGVITEDRHGMCRNVIAAAEQGQVEIATSTLSFAEVCKNPGVKAQGEDKISAYFENDYLLMVNLDRAVGEKARALLLSGISKLKPPDACHLATALLSGIDEMHTFDERLVNLSGLLDKSDGTKLKICKPDPGGKPAPLLDAMKTPIVTKQTNDAGDPHSEEAIQRPLSEEELAARESALKEDEAAATVHPPPPRDEREASLEEKKAAHDEPKEPATGASVPVPPPTRSETR